MPAELHIIGLIVVFFGVAYFVIYPRMDKKTLSQFMQYDAVSIVMLMGMAWWLYGGTGQRFSMLVFETNWIVFTFIMAIVLEIPFTIWFCRKWGISMRDDDD